RQDRTDRHPARHPPGRRPLLHHAVRSERGDGAARVPLAAPQPRGPHRGRPPGAAGSPPPRSEAEVRVVAGWGDDPQLAELRTLVYEDGWTPVSVAEGAGSVDTVVIEKDGEQKTFSSDHIAFHRFVEGVKEDFGL